MKILIAIGTRPEAIKMAPLIIKLKEILKNNTNGWVETFNKNQADVEYVWCNADDDVLIKAISSKGKAINRYPGIKGLSHKD